MLLPVQQYRYTLLCLAALEAPLQLAISGSTYGDDCIFIANDWHASMVPVYLAAKYRPGGVYGSARSVLAIHNLRHQVGARRQHMLQGCPLSGGSKQCSLFAVRIYGCESIRRCIHSLAGSNGCSNTC